MRVSSILVMLVACGGGGGRDDGEQCGLEEILEGTEIEDLAKLGSIAVQERPGEGGTIERFARGSFLDFALFDGDDPPAQIWDGVCAGVSGDPVAGEHDPVPLTTPGVSLDHAGQTVALQEAGLGKLIATTLEPFEDGETMGVDVEGGSGEDEFPSFSAELTVPAAPGIGEIDDDGGALVVRWTPAGSDAIHVVVNIVDPPEGFQPVRCVVRDDGCLTVPSRAMLWLTQSAEPVPLDVQVTAQVFTEWMGTAEVPEVGFFEVKRTRSERFEP